MVKKPKVRILQQCHNQGGRSRTKHKLLNVALYLRFSWGCFASASACASAPPTGSLPPNPPSKAGLALSISPDHLSSKRSQLNRVWWSGDTLLTHHSGTPFFRAPQGQPRLDWIFNSSGIHLLPYACTCCCSTMGVPASSPCTTVPTSDSPTPWD